MKISLELTPLEIDILNDLLTDIQGSEVYGYNYTNLASAIIDQLKEEGKGRWI